MIKKSGSEEIIRVYYKDSIAVTSYRSWLGPVGKLPLPCRAVLIVCLFQVFVKRGDCNAPLTAHLLCFDLSACEELQHGGASDF